MAPWRQAPRDHSPFSIRHVTCVAQPAALIIGTSDFSPWHGGLPRIFANPMESQPTGITRSFFSQALRCEPLRRASKDVGGARGPSFETPRKSAATQDDD